MTLLYAGLGWVSGLRLAMETTFELPKPEKRNFVVGKAIDFGALVLIGVFLVASVGVAGTISGAAGDILELVNLDETALGEPLLWVVGVLLGLAASTVLFFVIYQILGHPPLPKKALWAGALFGAIGFELLEVPCGERDRGAGWYGVRAPGHRGDARGLDQLLLQVDCLRRLLGDDRAAGAGWCQPCLRRFRGRRS